MPTWMHLPAACRLWNATALRSRGRRRRLRDDHAARPRGLAALTPSLTCLPVAVDDTACSDEERPRGCGWFDSSHELQVGLQVLEHEAPDAVARELPVGAWLDLYLGLRSAGGTGACLAAVD